MSSNICDIADLAVSSSHLLLAAGRGWDMLYIISWYPRGDRKVDAAHRLGLHSGTLGHASLLHTHYIQYRVILVIEGLTHLDVYYGSIIKPCGGNVLRLII